MQGTENLEYILGKGLMEPFANTNSGSRKLMFGVNLEQALPLSKPEVPIIQTGYEIRYGDLSSAIVKAESDFEVIAKINKFSHLPNHHYLLINMRYEDGQLDVIERSSYNHIGETYGYLYNTNILDNLDIGYQVPKDNILRTSVANDEYMNRCDGTNLLVSYISSDKDIEDGIVLSESAAEKLASPLIKKVTIIVGDNDILLNLYGKDGKVKSLPDVGEYVQDGILCALRKEKIEECLYMQSVDRLSDILMSDEKFSVEGKVIDLDIYSNNPEALSDKYSNCQIDYYYKDHLRYLNELVNVVESHADEDGNVNLSHALEIMYWRAKYELDGMQFEKEKRYDGTILDIYIMEESIPKVGDKITNRYGGKGVISYIVPDNEMPILDNGQRLDAYFNSCTCVNRLNQGQLNELSLNFAGTRLCEYISDNGHISTMEAINLIYDFISFASQEEADDFMSMMYDPHTTEEDREWFINEMLEDGYILLSNKPITESMSLDKLRDLYAKFPFIKPYSVLSKITDSNGNPRYVKGRRTLVAGKMYIYRLKQYAEDKFSATSLSSTNLANENTKSKASKNYRAVYPNTPIRFGEMEAEDERHMGTDIVVENLMIHSTSPQARRLTAEFIEGDPYTIDIRLDGTCKSRSAEKAKVYLKAMGYRISFRKIPKIKKRLFERVEHLPLEGQRKKLFYRINEKDKFNYTAEEWMEVLKKQNIARRKRLFQTPLFERINKDNEET